MRDIRKGTSSVFGAGGRKWRAATFIGIAAVLGAGIAAGCGGDDSSKATTGGGGSEPAAGECAASSGPVKLDFWTWVPGVDKAVAVWNKENPDIQVKVKNTPAGNAGTYQNMFNALKAGTAPDLGQIEFDSLPAFRLQDAVRDVAACGAADVKDGFVPWTLGQVSFGTDSIYAIPQDTGPMALYYRKDLFTKFGVKVPTTWDEFATAAATIHKKDPTVYITHFPQRDTNWFAGLAWQNSAKWFATEGDSWKVSVNDDATKKVADYWQGLLDKKLVANLQGFSPQWNNALAKGKVLTWVSAVWGSNTISTNAPKTAGNWAVAPMPQWTAGDQKAGNWGGSTTAVFSSSEHPLEATKFALWLNTDPVSQAILNKEGGLYPATNAGLDLPALSGPSEFYGGQKIFDVFKEASGQVDTTFQWGPIMTTTYTQLADGFGPVLNGNGTFGAVIDKVQGQTTDAITQQGLSVVK